MSFKLNDQQYDAVIKIMNWYYLESYKKQLFVLGGLAGTGKSTCLNTAIKSLGVSPNNVLYVALTGKAVSVLRIKGHNAGTCHRTFYNAKKMGNRVFFKLKSSIPYNTQLIVIDEFGMVTDNMTNEIMSFGIPVLATGDPGQLDPPMGKNTYINGKLDSFLDKVMRTDDSTGILQLASMARKGEPLQVGHYGNSRVLDDPSQIKDYSEYDMVVCWTNRTRIAMNIEIREKLGIKSRYPTKGERVIFKENRYDITIDYDGIEVMAVNGLECIVLSDAVILNDEELRVQLRPTFIQDDDNIFFEVVVSKKAFDTDYDYEIPTLDALMMDAREKELDMTFIVYSWCISTHSSQGSEAPNILVLDEMPKYRHEYKKWLYTALTRASKSVDILLDQN